MKCGANCPSFLSKKGALCIALDKTFRIGQVPRMPKQWSEKEGRGEMNKAAKAAMPPAQTPPRCFVEVVLKCPDAQFALLDIEPAPKRVFDNCKIVSGKG